MHLTLSMMLEVCRLIDPSINAGLKFFELRILSMNHVQIVHLSELDDVVAVLIWTDNFSFHVSIIISGCSQRKQWPSDR